MPTAAKLVAAACFLIVGLLFGLETGPTFKDANPPASYLPICIASGIWAGWVLCGNKAYNISAGIGTGLTAAIGMAVVSLFAISFIEMLSKSLRRAYEGPIEALLDVIELMANHAVSMSNLTSIGILICGGIVGGGVAGYFGHRYPN